jgi:DNA-3-methyladenine glycosylase
VGARLPRSFLRRPSVELAPDLLGRDLVGRSPDGSTLRARIVETEAYEPGDPASHAFRGPTRRNAVMFGPPGHLYVYVAYGVHHCMNIVAAPEGVASAVLLRAAQPLDGLDTMAQRRGTERPRDLCRGPGRWAQAFGVDRALDGADVVVGDVIWLERGLAVPADAIVAGPRIGITLAARRPWRFCVAGSPFLSRPAGALSPRRAAAASRS